MNELLCFDHYEEGFHYQVLLRETLYFSGYIEESISAWVEENPEIGISKVQILPTEEYFGLLEAKSVKSLLQILDSSDEHLISISYHKIVFTSTDRLPSYPGPKNYVYTPFGYIVYLSRHDSWKVKPFFDYFYTCAREIYFNQLSSERGTVSGG